MQGKVSQLERGHGYRAKPSLPTHLSRKLSNDFSKSFPTLDDAIKSTARSLPNARLTRRDGDYYRASDHVNMVVARFDFDNGDKQFRPFCQNGDGRWRLGDPPGLLPLQAIGRIDDKGVVIVVEGEKCREAAASIGFSATTSAHGASSAKRSDWSTIAFCNLIVMLPDADEAGIKYVWDATHEVLRHNPKARIKIVELPGLVDGEDIVDFLDRRDSVEPDTIRAEIEGHISAAPYVDPLSIFDGPKLTRLSDVSPQKIGWLWDQRIALGKITLIYGDPGGGKSTLTIDLAARLSTNSLAPDGTNLPGPATTIFITCEDGVADTILPRAIAAGADTTKLAVFDSVRKRGPDGKIIERTYAIADIEPLRKAIISEGAKLVVIDPASAYLGDRDGHRNDEIRGLLAPLAKLAEEQSVAIVLVTHMSKSGGGRAMYRAMGSVAFIAVARTAWAVIKDSENTARRLLLPVKNNVGNDRDGLAYSLVDRDGSAAIIWESKTITISVDEAMAAYGDSERAKPGPAPNERDSAAEWLTDLLEAGPMEVSAIRKAAIGDRVKWRTLERAKATIHVHSYRSEFGGTWMWQLSTSKDAPSAEVHPAKLPAARS